MTAHYQVFRSDMFAPDAPAFDGDTLLVVAQDDYQRLENAAIDVCIALAKYDGGPDAKAKLRDDIIDASDRILDAIGVKRESFREYYDTLRERNGVKENEPKL